MDKSLPLVSVIIPLYNAEPFIEQCINSVLVQTWSNIEVIIIDDGSTDDSFAVASRFAGNRVTVIKQANAGASAARNNGLAHAGGKYIQFLDADDLLSPDKIEAQVNLLEAAPDCLAICGTVYFNDGDNPYRQPVNTDWFTSGSTDPVDFIIKLYGGNGKGYGGMIQTNAWLIPYRLIDRAGLWNNMRSPDDDGEFFCRMMLISNGILYSWQGLNYYRKFKKRSTLSNRQSYQSSAGVLQSWLLKNEHLKSYVSRPGIKEALADNFTRLCYQNYPAYSELSHRAFLMAKHYGGLTHPPNFGNKFFNKFRKVLPWRMLLMLQYRYQLIKSWFCI